MKFIHRIGLRAKKSQIKKIEELGFKVPDGLILPGGGDPLIVFEADEDHPNWPALQALIRKWGLSSTVTTRFTKKEIESAHWLEILSDWHHGYPQPDQLDWGYLEATFDLTDYCERCGTGLKQNAPFQMKGEPSWGKRSILQMNWVFDEYFVTPEVWRSVFKPHGIDSRPVINRRGAELKTALQLVVSEEVGIEAEGFPGAVCPSCGRMKYLPVVRGLLPALKSDPSAEMVKTREYFGDGGQASKAVIVSQALRQSFVEEKVRGASFAPIADRSSSDQ